MASMMDKVEGVDSEELVRTFARSFDALKDEVDGMSPEVERLRERIAELEERVCWLEAMVEAADQFISSRLSRFDAVAQRILDQL